MYGQVVLAGLTQVAMLCSCFIPIPDIPTVFWRYPMHYLSFYTYAAHAAVLNEFEGTAGWACPCSLREGSCFPGTGSPGPGVHCQLSGEEVRHLLNRPCM